MAASALLGNEIRFQYMNTAVSPNAWTTLEAVFDFGELGENKPQVDITTLSSTARESRGGLADGVEIPVQANFAANSADFTVLYNAYKNDTTKQFRAFVPSASPEEGFSFSGVVLNWSVSGTPGERSVAKFGIKISGSVTRV